MFPDTDRREVEWPPPQPDPDREPSHPHAKERPEDDDPWERWLDDDANP